MPKTQEKLRTRYNSHLFLIRVKKDNFQNMLIMNWIDSNAISLSAEKNSQQLTDDDVAFWSFVKPDQRPKTVAEAYMNQDEDSEDQISDEEEEEDMDVE